MSGFMLFCMTKVLITGYGPDYRIVKQKRQKILLTLKYTDFF
jgi:hypothetical protein